MGRVLRVAPTAGHQLHRGFDRLVIDGTNAPEASMVKNANCVRNIDHLDKSGLPAHPPHSLRARQHHCRQIAVVCKRTGKGSPLLRFDRRGDSQGTLVLGPPAFQIDELAGDGGARLIDWPSAHQVLDDGEGLVAIETLNGLNRQ